MKKCYFFLGNVAKTAKNDIFVIKTRIYIELCQFISICAQFETALTFFEILLFKAFSWKLPEDNSNSFFGQNVKMSTKF